MSSRVPALIERRMQTSGYNFSQSPQSSTGQASYRFSSGPQVFSTAKQSKKIPALVPITGSKQTQNGFNNGLVSPPHRRSVFGANRYRVSCASCEATLRYHEHLQILGSQQQFTKLQTQGVGHRENSQSHREAAIRQLAPIADADLYDA